MGSDTKRDESGVMKTDPTSILAFRNGSIGNTLAAVPALHAIRRRYPNARLTVVVDTIGYSLLERCPWIDQLVIYEKHGKDRGILPHIRLIKQLRNVKPSHAILFKRFYRNGMLAKLSGAPIRAGFRTDNKAPFLNLTIPYDESLSVYHLNLKLAALLGADAAMCDLELFLDDNDRLMARNLLVRKFRGEQPYIAVHYGGQTTSPAFLPYKRFAELLTTIRTGDERIMIIGNGPSEEMHMNAISSLLPEVEFLSRLPIRVMAAVVGQARFFVGFNSGPAHIAAAAAVPSLVVFRPGENVQREIRKWLPPISHAKPVIPPSGTPDEKGWQDFYTGAKCAASELAILQKCRE
jgi:ADP-heptose:LPS heptosyltransferase